MLFQQILYENFRITYHFLFYALSACAVVLLVNTYLLFPTIGETADQPGREPKRLEEEAKSLKRKDDEEKAKAPRGTDDEVPVWKLVVSGGVVWSIVLMGVCRLRLWFFTASFHHFIGSLPGASETTGICGQTPLLACERRSLFAIFCHYVHIEKSSHCLTLK